MRKIVKYKVKRVELKNLKRKNINLSTIEYLICISHDSKNCKKMSRPEDERTLKNRDV